MQLHDDTFFMGIPIAFIWFPVIIGLVIGFIIPLTPIIRKKLHFSNLQDTELNSERDADALKELLSRLTRADRKKISVLLRELGLTLYIDK